MENILLSIICLVCGLLFGGLGLYGIIAIPGKIQHKEQRICQLEENQELLISTLFTLNTTLTPDANVESIALWLSPYLFSCGYDIYGVPAWSSMVPVVKNTENVSFVMYPQVPEATTILNPPGSQCTSEDTIVYFYQSKLRYIPPSFYAYYQVLDDPLASSNASYSDYSSEIQDEKFKKANLKTALISAWVAVILFGIPVAIFLLGILCETLLAICVITNPESQRYQNLSLVV